MSEELKPCPFCGEQVIIVELYNEGDAYYLRIEGIGCFAFMQSGPFLTSFQAHDINKKELIEMWNTRTNTTDKRG